MKTTQWRWIALISAALLAGCASDVKLDENAPPVETRTPTSVSDAASGAGSSGAAQSKVTSVDLNKQNAEAIANTPKVIYFDFDSFVIQDQYRSIIEVYAKVLSSDKSKRLVIEGHTDERGGREYNLALGQKRAEAVLRALQIYGVRGTQMEAVSWGESKPRAIGHDEDAWAQNRRADLQYPKR